VPLPSQFLHFSFFLPAFCCILSPESIACVSHAWRLVQKSLKTDKHFTDFFGPSKIGDGIRNRVVAFQVEQWRQFILIEFIDTAAHIMRQDEIEEDLLLGVEARSRAA
jgi:hypothetical protein